MAVKKEKIVANAEKLVSKRKIEAAIKEYQKIIDDNPNDTNILNRVGDLYTQINRIKDAIRVFQRIADHFADDGFFLRAIAILKKINKLDPSILEVYEKLGDLYLKQNMPREAANHFQYLADYYIRQEESEKALKIYERIVQMDPENIATRGKLADLFQKVGFQDKALEEYLDIGSMLAKRGHLQEAHKVFEQAAKLDPGNIELAKKLADTLTSMGKVPEAMKILKTAAENNPDDPEIVQIVLKGYENEGDFEAALETVQGALLKSPDDISLHKLKGSFLYKLNRPDDAAVALVAAADVALGVKDTSKAMEILQDILKKEPHQVAVLEKLLEIYQEQNQETYVIFTLSQLVEAFLQLNLTDRAEATAKKLIELEPENGQHREKLASIQDMMGKRPTIEEMSVDSKVEISADDLEELPDIQIPQLEDTDSDSQLLDAPVEEELSPELSEFVSSRMVEVDVFIKYGLMDRAIEQLEDIIQKVPAHIQAYQKLIEIHQQEKNEEELEQFASRLYTLFLQNNQGSEAETLKEQMLSSGITLSEPSDLPVDDLEATQPASISTEEADEMESGFLDIEGIEDEEEEMEISVSPEVEVVEETPEYESLDLSDIDDEDLDSVELAEEEPELVSIELPEEAADISPGDSGVTLDELGEVEPEIELSPEADEMPSPDLDSVMDLTPEELPVQEAPAEAASPAEEEAPAPTPPPKRKKASVPKVDFDALSADLFKTPSKKKIKPKPIEKVKIDTTVGLGDLEKFAQEVKGSGKHKKIKPVDIAQQIDVAPVAVEDPSSAPTVEQLGELDFYLDQELLDEARKIMDDLIIKFPDSQELLSRKENLDTKITEAAEAVGAEPEKEDGEALFADEEEFFDLASELEAEINAESIVPDEPPEEKEPSLDEIFQQFKKGVEQQLSPEDYDTHYNLGIAYKEMALLDEAISEFQVAAKSDTHIIECCSMLGMCFLDKGMPQLAEKWYRKGLEYPEISEEEQLGIMYDLANLYVQIGDPENAYKTFLDIYGIQSGYRDVSDRIKELETTVKPN